MSLDQVLPIGKGWALRVHGRHIGKEGSLAPWFEYNYNDVSSPNFLLSSKHVQSEPAIKCHGSILHVAPLILDVLRHRGFWLIHHGFPRLPDTLLATCLTADNSQTVATAETTRQNRCQIPPTTACAWLLHGALGIQKEPVQALVYFNTGFPRSR